MDTNTDNTTTCDYYQDGMDCYQMFNCCSCGGNNCGCRYCFDCNACDVCMNSGD